MARGTRAIEQSPSYGPDYYLAFLRRRARIADLGSWEVDLLIGEAILCNIVMTSVMITFDSQNKVKCKFHYQSMTGRVRQMFDREG